MRVVTNLTGPPSRRASLAVAFAAGIVLLAAPLCAAIVVNPWSGAPAATAEVAPADAVGLNVLEPTDNAAAPVPAAKITKGDVERTVGEWTPTDGPRRGSPFG